MSMQPNQAMNVTVSRDEIAKKVRQLIAEYSSVDVETVQETTEPHNDLGWDSLDDVEMVMELEEEFDINVPDDFGQEVKTVGDIVDQLTQLVVETQAN